MDLRKPIAWPTSNPLVIILALPLTLFLILFFIWGIVAIRSHVDTDTSASHQAGVARRIADTPPAYTLSPSQLLDAYRADPQAAIDKYQGQVIRIIGGATDITEPKRRNFMAKKSAAYVSFGGNTNSVRCLLPDDAFEAIRALPNFPRLSLQLKGVVQDFNPRHNRVQVEGCHLQ
jgi:hypothetical protein